MRGGGKINKARPQRGPLGGKEEVEKMRKLSLLDDRCSSLFLDRHGTSSTPYNKAKTTKNPRPVRATWSLSPFGGWFLEWHHQKHDIQLVVLSFFAVSSVSPFSFSFFDEVCSLATKKARSFFVLLFHLGMRRDGTRGKKGKRKKTASSPLALSPDRFSCSDLSSVFG